MCQAVVDTQQKDPLNTTEIPDKPWSTLCTDIFGPLPTGEYLLLVQDLHSRFPEVAITHSTSAASVIPAIDKILAAYGTPDILGSDNGPPFNSTEFQKFAKKLGFHHRKITPLAPWANGTAERFMKNLAKVIQIAHADRKNWRHELIKFLRAYRATPHSMTGATPASMLFNGRVFQTNLPIIRSSVATPEQILAQETDHKNKAKMKERADSHARVKQSNFKVGDQVLLKQKKVNKLTTAYETVPYLIEEVKGSQIIASNHIHSVCRHANMFKKLANRDPSTISGATDSSIQASPESTSEQTEEPTMVSSPGPIADRDSNVEGDESPSNAGTSTLASEEETSAQMENVQADPNHVFPSQYPDPTPISETDHSTTVPETTLSSTPTQVIPRQSSRRGVQKPARFRDPNFE